LPRRRHPEKRGRGLNLLLGVPSSKRAGGKEKNGVRRSEQKERADRPLCKRGGVQIELNGRDSQGRKLGGTVGGRPKKRTFMGETFSGRRIGLLSIRADTALPSGRSELSREEHGVRKRSQERVWWGMNAITEIRGQGGIDIAH